jgi:Leucine-rich repeat (LRR) protein
MQTSSFVIKLNFFSSLIVSIFRNQIKELHPSTFDGLVNLRWLCFSWNEINELHPATFKNLTNLEYFYFRSNQIEEIHPSTFCGLINLKRIDLAENQIRDLNGEVKFKNLTNKKLIFLSIFLDDF